VWSLKMWWTRKQKWLHCCPIDSNNCLPMGDTVSCRDELSIGDTSSIKPKGDGDTLVGGLITSDWFKILVGHPTNSFWWVKMFSQPQSPPMTPELFFPPMTPELHPRRCDRTLEHGCLFNVYEDPQELTTWRKRCQRCSFRC
jgi:hypothetical protein